MNREMKRSSFTLMDGLILLFVGLKLSGIIDWSWWLVLAPVWIGMLVYLIKE